MPVNTALAQLSNHFLLATVVLYALAMLAYAGDFAFGRRAAVGGGTASAVTGATAGAVDAPRAEPAAVAVGSAAAGGAAAAALAAEPGGPGAAGLPAMAGTAAGGDDGPTRRAWRSHDSPGVWAWTAAALTVVGVATHIAGILTRGLAEDRVPWGNMYEFVTAITCAAVLAFLVVLARYRVYSLGLFVMTPVVVILGLAATVLYTAAGAVVPALQSYWIAIHVTAMTIAIGSFIVAAVMTVLYLVADSYAKRASGPTPGGFGVILARLPSKESLDRLAYRTVVFAFPVWTFGVIAGAIWANQAWGRYWGWDPKETWSFITWVVYAGYLHARATAGWRGRTAACIQLLGFTCLLFNVVGVNLWITGLHSYAGVN